MFLRGSQDKDGIGRVLPGSSKSIEGLGRQHVYLVDDKHLVAAVLGLVPYLFNKRTNVLHAVVGSRIQLKNVKGSVFIERLTR